MRSRGYASLVTLIEGGKDYVGANMDSGHLTVEDPRQLEILAVRRDHQLRDSAV